MNLNDLKESNSFLLLKIHGRLQLFLEICEARTMAQTMAQTRRRLGAD